MVRARLDRANLESERPAIGVRPFDIWAFEEGKSRIGFDALLAVAKALRVSERYFYRQFRPAI